MYSWCGRRRFLGQVRISSHLATLPPPYPPAHRTLFEAWFGRALLHCPRKEDGIAAAAARSPLVGPAAKASPQRPPRKGLPASKRLQAGARAGRPSRQSPLGRLRRASHAQKCCFCVSSRRLLCSPAKPWSVRGRRSRGRSRSYSGSNTFHVAGSVYGSRVRIRNGLHVAGTLQGSRDPPVVLIPCSIHSSTKFRLARVCRSGPHIAVQRFAPPCQGPSVIWQTIIF